MSAPGAVEAWLRTNVPDADTLIYDFVDSTLDRYSVTVGTDGLLHATVALSGVCCTNVTMAGPNIPVTDGFWHYVVVDFANSFIYVDLTRGPQGTGGGGGSFGPSGFGTASTSLGGTNFDGQLDEVAVYDAALGSS